MESLLSLLFHDSSLGNVHRRHTTECSLSSFCWTHMARGLPGCGLPQGSAYDTIQLLIGKPSLRPPHFPNSENAVIFVVFVCALRWEEDRCSLDILGWKVLKRQRKEYFGALVNFQSEVYPGGPPTHSPAPLASLFHLSTVWPATPEAQSPPTPWATTLGPYPQIPKHRTWEGTLPKPSNVPPLILPLSSLITSLLPLQQLGKCSERNND